MDEVLKSRGKQNIEVLVQHTWGLVPRLCRLRQKPRLGGVTRVRVPGTDQHKEKLTNCIQPNSPVPSTHRSAERQDCVDVKQSKKQRKNAKFLSRCMISGL